jgi:hypothetical protein
VPRASACARARSTAPASALAASDSDMKKMAAQALALAAGGAPTSPNALAALRQFTTVHGGASARRVGEKEVHGRMHACMHECT